MTENICFEVAELAQTSTVSYWTTLAFINKSRDAKTKPMQAPRNFNVSHFKKKITGVTKSVVHVPSWCYATLVLFVVLVVAAIVVN